MLRKMRAVVATLVVGLASAATVVVTSEPAHAVYNCVAGYSTVGAYAQCSSPTNTWYHANVVCQNYITLSSYVKWGNWVNTNSGTPSTIQGCGAFEHYSGTPWASE
jgi:hypothetical protein